MLSYAIDVGDRVIPSVHIQLLKKYQVNEEDIVKVDRATVVLDLDQPGDDITDRYSELIVKGDELSKAQKEDIDKICVEYSDTLTKEPGLTQLVEFTIETGSCDPIAQRPYNTPAHFRESIDQEIDWLLENPLAPGHLPLCVYASLMGIPGSAWIIKDSTQCQPQCRFTCRELKKF